MKNRRVTTLLFAFILLIASEAGADLTRDQRISDARTMISLFENNYAPVLWKAEYLGIDLEDLTSALMGEAYRQDIGDEDFYAAMARVSGGVKDTHNWLIIPSTYSAYLGFSCDYIEGRYLIRYVNRETLPADKFPFYKGDELVSIDGQSAEEIIADLAQYSSEGSELAERRFLAGNLTYRDQRRFPYIPTGEATVEIFSQQQNRTDAVTIEWQPYGSPLAETPVSGINKNAEDMTPNDDTEDALADLERLRWSAIDGVKALEAGIGSMQPFYPLWDSFDKRRDYPLLSGTFNVDKHKIGFIRIPTWHPPESNSWFAELGEEIPYFEKKTDALVIDQTNNGGGNLCLANAISGFFVSKPISALLFHIRANRERVQNYEGYAEWCEEKYGKDFKDCKIIRNIADEVRRALAEGSVLTKPVAICGDDGLIHPMTDKKGRRYVYTKPMLILVNEWSISAADMFPAPLQDAGRAVIFGERTCGAGGSVNTSSPIGYSDFRISQTETLAVRPKETVSLKGVPTKYLENVGVAPDIQYSITTDDFMEGYEGYRRAVEDALRSIIK